jgi:gliding motility-associated lipoprotein GldD
MTKYTICIFVLFLSLSSCKDESYTPKPRAYPKVIYPKHAYQKFDKNYCNFTFDYPTYANIEQDTSFFEERPDNPCWFNLNIPSLNATVYFSYYDIKGLNTYDKLRQDAFTLAGKHNIKADFIEELPINKSLKVKGFAFNIEGAAASPFQFFLSDSTDRFLRGALYFNAQSKPDSIAPVVNFVKTDIMQLINTFEWNKK